MQTFGAFLVSLVAAGSLTAAMPSGNSADAGKFSVTAAHNKHFKAHGPAALAKAYRKFHKTVPQDVADAVARLDKRATGSVTNVPEQYDSEYLSSVSIGTPAQKLNLDFDTGSSDLWVFSSETQSSEVQGQALYNPSKSSTAKKLQGESWSITYGDQSSSSGDVWSDVVNVGGLSVKGQAVEAAKKVSAQFSQDTASSGLLGLAFSSINTVQPDQQTTFFDTALPSLDAPLFTANLNYHASKYISHLHLSTPWQESQARIYFIPY